MMRLHFTAVKEEKLEIKVRKLGRPVGVSLH